MKLFRICQLVVSATDEVYDVVEVLETLAVVRGHVTCDVRDPAYYAENAVPVPLNPEMEFNASFMEFSHCGHQPFSTLYLYENEDALVRGILGGHGQFNPFTSATVAFRHGKVSPFQLYYTDEVGGVVAFDKDEQCRLEHPFGIEYPNRTLVWL